MLKVLQPEPRPHLQSPVLLLLLAALLLLIPPLLLPLHVLLDAPQPLALLLLLLLVLHGGQQLLRAGHQGLVLVVDVDPAHVGVLTDTKSESTSNDVSGLREFILKVKDGLNHDDYCQAFI